MNTQIPVESNFSKVLKAYAAKLLEQDERIKQLESQSEVIADLRQHISRLSLDLSTLSVLNGNRREGIDLKTVDMDILTKLNHINEEMKAIGVVFQKIDSIT